MDNVKAANYNNANMETAHNDIRLATKIIGLVTARIQNLRKKKPNLQVTFCLLGDVLQNYVFDTFILRVDWNESGIPTKKIYLCLTPKKDFLNTENVTDSEADVNKILQISFSLFQQLQDISKHPLDKNLSQILKDVDPFDFSLILYTISDILLSLRVQVPPNNSPIIGTFETKKNGGFCLNAQHDVVKNAFTGSDHVLHCDFLSRTVWQDARIEAPDLNKLVKNSLQDYFWTLRDWPYGNITMEKYLRHIEELWRSRTILQNDSTKLHDIVSSLINAQHLVVPTDDLPASYMKQQFENHALSYVIVPDVPPILRCSRVKQVLERCCLKFLILCPEALKEWREDVLETICRSPALCEELVLSVVSVDNDLKKFLQRVRGSRCRVRVVTPIWKKETNDFLQTFHPSYSSWVDKWSNTERGRHSPAPEKAITQSANIFNNSKSSTRNTAIEKSLQITMIGYCAVGNLKTFATSFSLTKKWSNPPHRPKQQAASPSHSTSSCRRGTRRTRSPSRTGMWWGSCTATPSTSKSSSRGCACSGHKRTCTNYTRCWWRRCSACSRAVCGARSRTCSCTWARCSAGWRAPGATW